MLLPLKQGLKLLVAFDIELNRKVVMLLPLKQGLKQMIFFTRFQPIRLLCYFH